MIILVILQLVIQICLMAVFDSAPLDMLLRTEIAEGTGVVAFTTVGRSSRTLAGLASELFDGARDGGP